VTRKYSLVIEGDPTGYSAFVPELPTILVTGRSVEELTDRAAEAIRLYWESVRTDRSPPRRFARSRSNCLPETGLGRRSNGPKSNSLSLFCSGCFATHTVGGLRQTCRISLRWNPNPVGRESKKP
jgi:predicted RNase H-like HicB family nuclease